MFTDLLAAYIAEPSCLPLMFGTIDHDTRRAIFARPAIRAALWRMPASELRARALREAAE